MYCVVVNALHRRGCSVGRCGRNGLYSVLILSSIFLVFRVQRVLKTDKEFGSNSSVGCIYYVLGLFFSSNRVSVWMIFGIFSEEKKVCVNYLTPKTSGDCLIKKNMCVLHTYQSYRQKVYIGINLYNILFIFDYCIYVTSL